MKTCAATLAGIGALAASTVGVGPAFALDCGPLHYIEIELPSESRTAIQDLSERLTNLQCAWSLKSRVSAPGRTIITFGSGVERDKLLKSIFDEFRMGFADYIQYPIGNTIRYFKLPESVRDGQPVAPPSAIPTPARPLMLFVQVVNKDGEITKVPELNHRLATALAGKNLVIWSWLDAGPDLLATSPIPESGMARFRAIPEQPRLVVIRAADRGPAADPVGKGVIEFSAHLLDEAKLEWVTVWRETTAWPGPADCTKGISDCEAPYIASLWSKLEGPWGDAIAAKLK